MLPPYLPILLMLFFAIVGLFLGQALLVRLFRYCGLGSIPPQVSGLLNIALMNAGLLATTWYLFASAGPGPAAKAFAELYVLLAFNGVALFYFFLILNASETSLHVHILMLLLVEGPTSTNELAEEYNPVAVVAARIERMIALGQLVQRGDCVVLTNRTLVIAGNVIAAWRKLLKLPLSPQA